MTRAVVLGGGMAGVLAAKALAGQFDDIVVLEGGRYPTSPGPRRGLPQGHHNHVLVAGGAEALETLLPGTLKELSARGAHKRSLSGGTLILGAQGWYRRHESDAYLISCSRWLLDHVVRQRAAVAIQEGVRVTGLTFEGERVTGARTDAGVVWADLVVDAMGRRSKSWQWLGAQQVVLDSGLAYATRLFHAPPDPAASIPAIMIHPRPGSGRGATLFPIEDNRWIVTLTGIHGSEPPADEQGFTEFAYSLASPIIAELMAHAKPIGGVRPYRDTANRRRQFGKIPGFLAIGDALLAVNPIHSHGMSIAALSALRLRKELNQAAVREEAERSWRLATQQGMRIAAATLSSKVLMAQLFRTQTLLSADIEESFFAELNREPDPPLTTEQAMAQYPALTLRRHA